MITIESDGLPWISRRTGLTREEMFNALHTKSGPNGCWEWKGCICKKGYGYFWDGKSTKAYRYSYTLYNGPIPEDKVLDHICRNKKCVNPSHLRAISNIENIMIGEGACAKNKRKTHCKRGHELTEDNLLKHSVWRGRECLKCKRLCANERYRKRKEEASE